MFGFEEDTSALDRIDDKLTKIEVTTIQVAKANRRLTNDLKLLEKEYKRGSITVQEFAREKQRLNKDLQEFSNGLVRAGNQFGMYNEQAYRASQATRRFGSVGLQQAGYQVGDFAVQVQGGTNALVALGQQGAQLLGIFGAFGALAGAGLAITTAITAPFIDEISEAIGIADLFKNNLSGLNKELKELRGEVARGQVPEFISDAVDEVRDLEESLVKAGANLNKFRKALDVLNEDGDEAGTNSMLEAMTLSYNSALETVLAIQDQKDEVQSLIAEYWRLEDQKKKNREEQERITEEVRLLEEEMPVIIAYSEKWEERLEANRRKMAQIYGLYANTRVQAEKLSAVGQPIIDTGKTPEQLRLENVYGSYANSRLQAPTSPVEEEEENLTGGGGSKSKPRDPLKDITARIELEKELIGASEARRRVLTAIANTENEYSQEAINNAISMVDANLRLLEVEQLRIDIAEQAGQAAGDAGLALIESTKSVKEAFSDMARDILKQLYQIYVTQQIIGGVTSILPAPPGASSSGFSFFSKGTVLNGRTNIGSVGGKNGVAGEADPEAIMPLARGPDGTLGVRSSGSSGSNVNVTYNIVGNGDEYIQKQIMKTAPLIAKATEAQIIESRARGGTMKRVFR